MSSKNPIESSERASEIARSGVEYEVFLSFRGPDTRSSFTDHLYVRLTDAGIRVYRDDEELRKGEKIGPELLKGIRESKIAIPIFSKGYATSKWCLKELAHIVECKRSNGLKVMPIFYDVTPSEVRNQTGDYGKAIESHEKCYDRNTIKSWKAALTDVGGLSGWDIHSSNSRFYKKEGELVKEVTKVVLQELKKAYLIVTDYLVGIEHHTKNLLEMSSSDIGAIQIFGIYGMGGIGKTTLAKVIYNHLLPNFESHSFLADIRETTRSKGMKSLYKRLISDILGKVSANISSNDEGIRIIRERFSNKKVVILLDDVDEIFQLDGLIGKRDYFGLGSQIIITTRNKSILESFQVDWSYELHGLETHQALHLFSKHAFRKDNPPKEYSIFAQKAVQITGGLPLALEVFGSLLCGKSSEVWDFTLKKLQVVPHEHVRKKLKISFEALDVQQKQIFLDIVCFFIGEDYRLVIHFWEESEFPKEAMEVFQQMSLIKIQEDHKIWMHDQLRDLGREILREEHREPKIIKQSADLRNMADKNIQSICTNIYLGHRFLSGYKFANLPNLKILRVERSYYSHERASPVTQKLKYFILILKDCLHWGHLFPFSELRWLSLTGAIRMHFTRNMNFQKLAILDLSCSSIKSSWSGWSHIKMAKNLKVLNLAGCKRLVKTPDLSCHLLLEQLILQYCEGLVEIDKSISMLQHLIMIDLRGCKHLKKLPKELSCMESLEELDISYSGIVEIPSWPLMRRLRVFHSYGCADLKNICSLDFAVNITELSLERASITVLPDSIGKLVNLLKLSLQGCTGIKTLPESIGDLVSLVELELGYSEIVELPETIGNIRNLKTLTISRTPLRRLPTAIGMMENLMSIDAQQCYQLQDIPELPQSLISLVVSGARTPRIPDLSNLINLKHLHLHLDDEPVDLVEAGSSAPWWIGRVTTLETLELTSKRIISLHEDLGMLSHLRTLELFSCTELRSVSKLPSGLINLKIEECTSLRTLMDLPSSLKSLHIGNCSSLETFLDLSHLKKLACSHELEKLYLCGCVFSEIDDLNMLENLATLHIKGCMNLWSLPDLSCLKKLEELQVQSFPNLVEIPGIDMLENLERLYIVDHAQLQSPPSLSNLKKLKDLKVQSCPNLVEIPGIDMLENLEKLVIENCAKVQNLPDLSNLKKLEDLTVRSCPNMVQITGRLESLRRTWFEGSIVENLHIYGALNYHYGSNSFKPL